MGSIQKLNKDLVSLIAAGEVIERPANVVKELIENAIDAQSSEITVNITNYGLTKIEVLDDGFGMSKEDLLLCILPHTTSKISEPHDLQNIKTLGFRGEALSSIAIISDLMISSREKTSQVGHTLQVRSGKNFNIKSIGRNVGTTVIVSNLFKNIPARKKFLQSKQTELRHIVEVVTDFCYSHSEVHFTLTHNGKVIIEKPRSSLAGAISTLLGEEFANNLLSLKSQTNIFSISGFIGKPQISVGTSSKLRIFINKRKVIDKLTLHAIKEAYGTLLMSKSFPVGIVFIEISPHLIDVNVHPAKEEIRFLNPKEVSQELQQVIVELLSKHNLTYSNISFKIDEIREDLKKTVLNSEIAQIGKVTNNDIFQIHSSYLISETKNGFQIIDQHAAHESLLYFEFLKKYKEKLSQSTSLKKPLVIHTRPSLNLQIMTFKGDLEQIGFGLEEFGDNSFRISAIPSVYTNQNISQIIEDLLDILSEHKKGLSEKEHLMIATLACKSAIKAGQALEQYQMKKLVSSLSEKHYTYTCPHGRPVKIEFTLGELARMFRRK